MIDRIRLVNFKCFENLDLRCSPLTLLCGMNGMGKSSIIQALLLLRQSYETRELLDGRLLLDGDRVDLGTGSDVLFEDADSNELGINIESESAANLELKFGVQGAADLLGPAAEQTKGAVGFRAEDRTEESVHNRGSVRNSLQEALLGWSNRPPIGGRLVHVNADRLGPRKIYPLSDVHALRGDFGSSSEYAWNYLSQHRDRLLPEGDPRIIGPGRTLESVANHWLGTVCPGVQLQLDPVRSADSVVASFTFERAGDVASKPHRAINVGFGLSYALPAILALLSPRNTLCLIENPEAHLHPNGQTRIAELAARAVCAGIQVIAETHSDHFMDGVRIAVRTGLIDPATTSFHYFERSGNNTTVSSPKINADGRLSHWPSGFFDQHDANLAKLIAPN